MRCSAYHSFLSLSLVHSLSLSHTRAQLTDLYGDDARLYVLHVLLDEVDFFGSSASGAAASTPQQALQQQQRDALAALKRQLCTEVCAELYAQPNATQLVATALQTRGVSLELLIAFSRIAALSLPAQCALALALVNAPPTEAAARDEGLAFLKHKFADIAADAAAASPRLPPAVARDVLFCARAHPGVSAAQTRALVAAMRQTYPEAVTALAAYNGGAPGGADDYSSQRRAFSSAPDSADELSTKSASTVVCDAVYAAGYACSESAPLFRATVAAALSAQVEYSKAV